MFNWLTLIFAIAKFFWELIQSIKNRRDLNASQKAQAIKQVLADEVAAKKAIRESGDRKPYDEFVKKYSDHCGVIPSDKCSGR